MPPTFADLGVPAQLCGRLTELGIAEPFPVQAATLPDALAGRDVCGKAPTGSGKTIAFGLPLLARITKATSRRPTALVLVPTRELASQVQEQLEALCWGTKTEVLAIYGGAGMDRQMKKLGRGVEVVVATPGRLKDLLDRGALRLDDVQIVVIDEADRMADMGFLPEVRKLLDKTNPKRQTMLFSATLDGDVDHLVSRYQNDPVRHEIVSTTATVTEMKHRFLYVHQMDKPKVVASIVRGGRRTLVFTRTKRGADRLVEQLLKEDVKAAAIHGDLRQQARERALKHFTNGSIPILVATDVAARGLHIDSVDTVVHFDPPEDHKTYLHRSGRTARAGASGVAVTMVLWDQVLEIQKLQKRLGLDLPIVEVFSNDARLADLADWADDAVATVGEDESVA
jgi:superfamily II DNA/RNA helicase